MNKNTDNMNVERGIELEYNTLRSEILKRIELRQQLVSALVHKSKSKLNSSIEIERSGHLVTLRHTQVRHSVESRATD